MIERRVGEVTEVVLQARESYSDPVRQQSVRAAWHGPDGAVHEVEGFWDGGHTWRVRFAASTPGVWAYETRCSDGHDDGLAGHTGSVAYGPADADLPLWSHGPLRVAPDGHHLEHADGTPFLWLCDTAWNGVLKAATADWERYLARRKEQGFTAVQFVLTHWRAFAEDDRGERAFSAGDAMQVNPAFFQRLDAKVAAVNRAGLLAAPVLLWAIRASGDLNPGYSLSEEDAVVLARYMVARYGAYQVAWFLGGDGDYRDDKAERWRRIGRKVFGERHDGLVTMHPQGVQWVGAEFRGEPWFDFIGYQSGHGDSESDLRWLTQGPPAQDWQTEPIRPIINLEPNYEGHVSYHARRRFTDREVRRGLYWSLLVSPTAGVTYGHHGIWPWMEEPGVPMDHPSSGEAPPWHVALESPGATSVAHLRRFLDGLPWWRLRPAPELLIEQPGDARVEAFVAVSATPERDTVVAYLPLGGEIVLRVSQLPAGRQARWYDPAGGRWVEGGSLPAGDEFAAVAPGDGDWVLVLS